MDGGAMRLAVRLSLTPATPMKTNTSRRSGHTFLEVLFSAFLALVSALILTASMPVANVSRAKADFQNLALSLAQKQMEAVRGVDPSLSAAILHRAGLIDSTSPIGTNTWSFTNVDHALFDNPARVLPSGTGRITVELIDVELRRVTITVTWREQGQTRTLTIGTLIADLNT